MGYRCSATFLDVTECNVAGFSAPCPRRGQSARSIALADAIPRANSEISTRFSLMYFERYRDPQAGENTDEVGRGAFPSHSELLRHAGYKLPALCTL